MKYTRREFIKGLGVAAVATQAVPAIMNMGKSSQDRPNILWLMGEDNSPFLGCYGDMYAVTPNIDRLAAEGVVYTRAYCSSPVCAPARNTLLTGVYSPSLGNEHMRSQYPIPKNVRFFTEYLRDAGYYCTNRFKEDYNCGPTPPGAWDRNVLSWFAAWRTRKSGQPFFHVINIPATHEGYLQEWRDNLVHDPRTVKLPPFHPDTPEFRHDYAQYYDQITKMDSQVGRVLEMLGDEIDNTIVFYFSDHGGILPGTKRFLREWGVRVPLVIRFPGKYRHLAPKNKRDDSLVSCVDFAPAILGLAGCAVPGHMQGRDFLKAGREYVYCFRGRMDERFDMMRSVTERRYKYIRNYMPHLPYAQHIEYLWAIPSMRSWQLLHDEGKLSGPPAAFFGRKPPEELYDLKNDPYEINNLAGDPLYRDELLRLRKECGRWSMEIRDAGFLHEVEMVERAGNGTIYDMVHNPEKYNLNEIMYAADRASMGANSSELNGFLRHSDSAVRYWGAVGCLITGAKCDLAGLLDDPSVTVRITAAQTLCAAGDTGRALPVLSKALGSGNQMVRLYAANAVDYIGERARPLLPVMKKMRDDEYEDVRKVMKWAVAKLEPTA